MSWCGGGEISWIPGTECRSRAISSVTLCAGQLAALAGLGALDDLDLQLLGPHQVLRGHAEPRGGHLLDPVVRPVAVGEAVT